MHRILVIRLYFPLDALHVSDYISPPSGAIFYRLYIVFGISRYHTSGCCVAVVGLYTYCKVMHGAYNVKLIWHS